MASAASSGTTPLPGAGSSAYPRPVGPCVSAAVRSGRARGRSAPAATGMSDRPASSSTASVLRTMCGSSTLPATQPTATISASGDAAA